MKYLLKWTMCGNIIVKKKRLITNRNCLHKRMKCDKINLTLLYTVLCIQYIIRYTLYKR